MMFCYESKQNISRAEWAEIKWNVVRCSKWYVITFSSNKVLLSATECLIALRRNLYRVYEKCPPDILDTYSL